VNLELMAMRWLRYEKRLPIVVRERSPRYFYCGQPDVLGVSESRYMTEVEIKRSRSDFYADFQKRSRRNREVMLKFFPKQFYYLVPENIAATVEAVLPDWAGLLVAGEDGWYGAKVIRVAPVNKLSQRLTLNECVRLAHQMGNYVLSTEISLDQYMCRFRDGGEPLAWPGVIDFSI